jgi:hypothetical protein
LSWCSTLDDETSIRADRPHLERLYVSSSLLPLATLAGEADAEGVG